MKKILNGKLFILSVLTILTVFVVAACTKVSDDEMTMDNSEKMESESSMEKEDTMTKEDMSDSDHSENMEDVAMMKNDGEEAPDFEFMDLDGNVHKLSDYSGKKVYLKYWASWCSICLAGLSEVDELFAETEDYIVLTVVTPGANGEKSKEDFIEWFNGLGYENINVLFDMNGEVGKELGIRAFPTSVFIGSDGVLVQVAPGHKDNDSVNEMVSTYY